MKLSNGLNRITAPNGDVILYADECAPFIKEIGGSNLREITFPIEAKKPELKVVSNA